MNFGLNQLLQQNKNMHDTFVAKKKHHDSD